MYRRYKPCDFLEFVWTDCWGNKSNYVITSPANRQIWLYTALFNQLLSHRLYSLYGVFWKFGSLCWRNREMGALWWCNDKLGPLYNVIGNSRSQWGPLDDEMHKLGLLTTWWEIILMAWWGKLGALDSVIENFGPFDDAMGKLETLDKAMRKLCGGG